MALDALEADLVGRVRNDVDGAAPLIDGFDLMLRVMHRDDPRRRSYLQRRWHGHSTTIPLLRELGRYKLERRSVPTIALSRR
jgi:hypothetical protein